jgi:hypothetical protein
MILTTARASESSPTLTAPQVASIQASTTQYKHSNNTKMLRSNSASVIAPKVALATHLKQIGAKFYGTFGVLIVPSKNKCLVNKLFVKLIILSAMHVAIIATQSLYKARISGFPTWEINGTQYRGMKSLKELADLSGYKGERNFGN